MQGAGCRVQDSGCRVQGAGCRVQGAGFRVQGTALLDVGRWRRHVPDFGFGVYQHNLDSELLLRDCASQSERGDVARHVQRVVAA